MGKKRKSIATSMDEVDRTMYASFCTAANSLSQLYSHSSNLHKLSFQAGERQGLESLYQWIWKQQEEGARVTTMDILNYIKNELDYCGEETFVSSGAPTQEHQSYQSTPFPGSGLPASSGASGPTTATQGTLTEHCDQQPKNSIFSNALSSPVRRNLQNYQMSQGGYHLTTLSSHGVGSSQSNSLQPNRSSDSSMEM